MKKEFETPTIDLVYFDQNIKLEDESDEFYDENLDPEGWV